MELNPLDPLFRQPLLAGLLMAAVLPVLGVYLRLRDEWLAALGLAHLSAAGGLAGLAAGVPAVVGGPAAALLGAGAKGLLGGRGNTAYAVMILLGWSLTLLLAANTALGEALIHALVDGQLYFAAQREVLVAVVLALLAAVTLPWAGHRLLRARFFPLHETANRLPAWRWHLGFDLLVALGMAWGTATLGLMAAFAAAFLPAWLAFRLAGSWRAALLWAVGLGLSGFGAAFVLALRLDQPFGPVMVAVLLAQAPPVWWVRGRRRPADAAP